jgi:signal transduction histidine kinase
MFFEIACAAWAIGDGFEAAATTIQLKYHWSQISYFGITSSALMFLFFTLIYSGLTRFFNKRVVMLLLVIPVVTMIMAFTNHIHHLLWSDIVITEGTTNGIYYYGPWFWVNVVFQYSLTAISIFLLITGAFKVFSLYKIQFWILLPGAIMPLIASILYIFKLFPVKGVDPTPIAFIISGLFIGISLYWFRMFNIMPIARKQAIDNLNDGMLIIDSDGRIMDCNPVFCNFLEMGRIDVINKKIEDIFSFLGIRFDDFCLENGHTIEYSRGKIENQLSFELKCHKVLDKNQNTIGRILMLYDITTKKMILDALADSNASREKELIEKEKLIRDLDAYARSVAHDLKNPVGAVMSLSELIVDSLQKEDYNQAAEMSVMVQNQSEKMVKIIDALLLLSGIRNAVVEYSSVNLNVVIEDVIGRIKPEISKYNAIVDIQEDLGKVIGYEPWIEEVLVNIMSNGIKYGGRPPIVRVGSDRLEDGRIKTWIQDNGNGIPSDSFEKVFNDFERLRRTDIPGSGLGLPIVKRIIEKLGGEVSIESTGRQGEGCRFSFTLRSASQTNDLP